MKAIITLLMVAGFSVSSSAFVGQAASQQMVEQNPKQQANKQQAAQKQQAAKRQQAAQKQQANKKQAKKKQTPVVDSNNPCPEAKSPAAILECAAGQLIYAGGYVVGASSMLMLRGANGAVIAMSHLVNVGVSITGKLYGGTMYYAGKTVNFTVSVVKAVANGVQQFGSDLKFAGEEMVKTLVWAKGPRQGLVETMVYTGTNLVYGTLKVLKPVGQDLFGLFVYQKGEGQGMLEAGGNLLNYGANTVSNVVGGVFQFLLNGKMGQSTNKKQTQNPAQRAQRSQSPNAAQSGQR